jgi:hypothetical protein
LEELKAGSLVAVLEEAVGLGFEVPEVLGKEVRVYPVECSECFVEELAVGGEMVWRDWELELYGREWEVGSEE